MWLLKYPGLGIGPQQGEKQSPMSGFPEILRRSLACMQQVTNDTLIGNILFTARKVSQDSQLQRTCKNLVVSQATASLEPDGLAIACLCVGKQFSHTSYKCCHSNWYFFKSKRVMILCCLKKNSDFTCCPATNAEYCINEGILFLLRKHREKLTTCD